MLHLNYEICCERSCCQGFGTGLEVITFLCSTELNLKLKTANEYVNSKNQRSSYFKSFEPVIYPAHTTIVGI